MTRFDEINDDVAVGTGVAAEIDTTPEIAAVAEINPSRANTPQEILLLSTIRLLSDTVPQTARSPVDRALLHGAQVLFDDLSRACREALGKDNLHDVEPADANEKAESSVPGPETSRTRRTRRGSKS